MAETVAGVDQTKHKDKRLVDLLYLEVTLIGTEELVVTTPTIQVGDLKTCLTPR